MITLYTVNTNEYEKNSSEHFFGKHTLDIEYVSITSDKYPDRFYKMLPSLQKFEAISVYCDANMTLEKPDELIRLCHNLANSQSAAIFFKHPDRTTARQEIVECIARGLLLPKALNQYNSWRREGFPDNIQLMENNVIIRKTYDPELIKCEEEWFKQYEKGMTRDQPSLPYAMWKTGFQNFILMEQQVKETIFKWSPHKT